MASQAAMDSDLLHVIKTWRDDAALHEQVNWEGVLSRLSHLADLITPGLSIEEIIQLVYPIVNEFMDAFQFSVGVYNEEEKMLVYKGSIENGVRMADVWISVLDDSRLTGWCIRHEKEIFVNDIDAEHDKYVHRVPRPYLGLSPKAALYVPLKWGKKVAAVITVRTIHRNVYSRHHLYILKMVGDLIIRSLAHNEADIKFFQAKGQKNWKWNKPTSLQPSSKKLLDKLTTREKEVLLLLVGGHSVKAIAARLFLSPGTVKTHTLNIYQKMDVNSRTQAVVKSIELGWLA